MRILALILIIICTIFKINAQISNGGIPLSFKYGISINPVVHEMPHITDSIEIFKNRTQKPTPNKKFEYAYNFATFINVPSNAEWLQTPNGFVFCNILIRSENALSLGLILESIHLLPGEKIYIFNKNYSQIIGAFTSENNNQAQILPTADIAANEIILEFIKPIGQIASNFNIATVIHGYSNAQTKSYKTGFGASCSNEVNINCGEGLNWQIEKQAVIKLRVPHYNSGTEICTGTLLNNTSNNGKPIILTANHCKIGDYEAPRLSTIFNYESPNCQNIDVSQSLTITGASVLADNIISSDACLIQLNSDIPSYFKPYFAGWSLDTLNNTSTVTIHHPAGDVKKISIDNDAPKQVTYDWYLPNSNWHIVNWESGLTEGGSSGCALFNQEHLVIGALTGGNSCCLKSCDQNVLPNTTNDYYYMFSRAYNYYSNPNKQLKAWLDPLNLNPFKLQGTDLYAIYYASCDTISNILANEQKSSLIPHLGSGYLSGHNSLNFNTYAEKFENTTFTYLSGTYLNIAHNQFTPDTKIEVNVWEGNIEPTSLLYEIVVNASSLESNNYIKFKGNINSALNIFVGYKIFYSGTDTFALYMANNRESTSNTAYVLNNSTWELLSKYNNNNYTSLDIKLVKNSKINPDKIKSNYKQPELFVYPNPVNSIMHISSKQPITSIELYNILGYKIPVNFNLSQSGASANVSSLQSGTYFAKVTVQNKIITLRVIVQK